MPVLSTTTFWMPQATTVMQFGSATLGLVASGLAVVQHIRAFRKRKAVDRATDDEALSGAGEGGGGDIAET
jgi:hypothetical protein